MGHGVGIPGTFREEEAGLPWRQQEVLATYRRFHRANKHKMEPIPVCEVPDDVRFRA